jgi:hypothetical protein
MMNANVVSLSCLLFILGGIAAILPIQLGTVTGEKSRPYVTLRQTHLVENFISEMIGLF